MSTACAIGIFGSQLGIALGFILPPLLVKNHSDVNRIGDDLHFLTCLLAGAMTMVTVTIIFCGFTKTKHINNKWKYFTVGFPDRPPLPPSPTQLNKVNSEGFIASLKILLRNKAFLIHATAAGINGAIYAAFATLLGQVTVSYFPVIVKSQISTRRLQ